MEQPNLNHRSVQVTDLKSLKLSLLYKHGTLTNAAKKLEVDYISLIHVLGGRVRTSYILDAIQEDLNLSHLIMDELFPRPLNAREHKLAHVVNI